MQLLRGTTRKIGKYNVMPCEHVGTKDGVHFDMKKKIFQRSDCQNVSPPPRPPTTPISDRETSVVP